MWFYFFVTAWKEKYCLSVFLNLIVKSQLSYLERI
jgi:hypothetical protein